MKMKILDVYALRDGLERSVEIPNRRRDSSVSRPEQISPIGARPQLSQDEFRERNVHRRPGLLLVEEQPITLQAVDCQGNGVGDPDAGISHNEQKGFQTLAVTAVMFRS